MTTGSELLARILDKTGEPREGEILASTVSPWILSWIPITAVLLEGAGEAAKVTHEITYYVARDGWSVGPADDWIRTPLAFTSAKRLAKSKGWTFPTRKMVKQIHQAADVRVAMPTFGPPREASSTYKKSHDAIEAQRAGRAGLVSGGKKDLVLSSLLGERTTSGSPSKQIFGGAKSAAVSPEWWQGTSSPPAHDDRYVDYSEQYRPIRRDVIVDGKPMDLHDVIRSPVLAALVSDESPPSYDPDVVLAGGSAGAGAGGGVKGGARPFAPAATPAARGLRAGLAWGVAGLLVWGARALTRWIP